MREKDERFEEIVCWVFELSCVVSVLRSVMEYGGLIETRIEQIGVVVPVFYFFIFSNFSLRGGCNYLFVPCDVGLSFLFSSLSWLKLPLSRSLSLSLSLSLPLSFLPHGFVTCSCQCMMEIKCVLLLYCSMVFPFNLLG